MKISTLITLAVSLTIAVGCKPATPLPAPVAVAGPQDAAGLAEAFESVGGKVKRDASGNIIELDLRGAKLGEQPLASLGGTVALESLLVSGPDIKDADLEILSSLSLKVLDARDCAITNAGMKSIGTQKELRALRLSGKSGACTVDDDGLKEISQLTQLKALSLDYLWVSEVGLTTLAALTSLEELNLAKTLVGNEALAVMGQFPRLKKLRISQCQIDDMGLVDLVKVSTLEDLDLSENSQISNAGMESIGKLTSLKKLNLWRDALTDDGVRQLAGLTNLEWLNLDNTQLSDAGLDSLQGMHKLTFLHLGSTSISDAGLPKLTGLTALKDLKVTRTAVSQAGVDELKKSLTSTAIQLEYIVSE